MDHRKELAQKNKEVTEKLKEINPLVWPAEQDYYKTMQQQGESQSAFRGVGYTNQHTLSEHGKSVREGERIVEMKAKKMQDLKEEQKRFGDKLTLIQKIQEKWEKVDEIQRDIKQTIHMASSTSINDSEDVIDDIVENARLELKIIQAKNKKVTEDEIAISSEIKMILRELPDRLIAEARKDAKAALNSGNRNVYLSMQRKIAILEERVLSTPKFHGGAHQRGHRLRSSGIKWSAHRHDETILPASALHLLNTSIIRRTINKTTNKSYTTLDVRMIHSAAVDMRAMGYIPEADAIELWEKVAETKNQIDDELRKAEEWYDILIHRKGLLDSIAVLEKKLETLQKEAEEATEKILKNDNTTSGGRRTLRNHIKRHHITMRKK
jgi:hypothetical protein